MSEDNPYGGNWTDLPMLLNRRPDVAHIGVAAQIIALEVAAS